ncbi:methyltransferase 13, partial [Brachionus plicatilis]
MSNSLNLIPGSGKEFRDKEYWDKFFKIRGSKAFEWYGEYENLCGLLHKYIKLNEHVLVVGCGNSRLSENMYDVGIKNIVNVDLSSIVIQQMSAKNKNRKEMQFIKMDILSMEFDDAKFDAVVDKGTLDALMSDYSEKVDQDVDKMFNEIDRVLRVGGRYMCISLAQDHILNKLLESFKEKGWFIRIHRINEQDLDFYLPVFVFVFTKMKIKLTNLMLELQLDFNNEKFQRVNSIEEARNRIKEYQHYGLTKFYISNKTIDISDEVFVYLYDEKNQRYPRYTIYIVDLPGNVNKTKLNGIFAVFVVPIGKEIEWLFATKLGREELTSQAKYQRLAIVHLNRDHQYQSLDAIISELSPKVMDLAPKGIPSSYKIPLLSMGPDVDVRDLKFKNNSQISGEFFVEDVTPSDSVEPTRRLVFQNITPLIQTEIILKE